MIYFVLTFTVTRILRFIERRMDMDTYTTGANQNANGGFEIMTQAILEIKHLKNPMAKTKC